MHAVHGKRLFQKAFAHASARKIVLPTLSYSLWIHTMKRCTPALTSKTSRALAIPGLAALLCAAAPAQAQQVPGGMGEMRNFPDASLRGNLTVLAGSQATLNGNPIRMAPGMRLFSPQNTLVMLHTVQGQTFKVNYLVENSTGMLLSAWILTEGEAAQARKGSDTIQFNFRTESDPLKK